MSEPTLTPPSATAGLVLEPPKAVAAVVPQKAGGMVPIDAAALPGLDKTVANYVESILSLDVHSPAFTAKAEDIRTMGDADIRGSAETSNRLLQTPMRAMQRGGASETSKISKTLVELRRTVEDLDPKEATGVKKLLGIIPFGDKLEDYFRKYESSQKQLDAIINALYDGQDELRKDNASLEQEKIRLWEVMQRLAQYIYIADRLDDQLADKIAEVELADAERAKALKDDVLFYVRQKHQDLLTQLAVSIQGYLAIDMIRKNNIELVKGVDRATTTTVAALRTAVIVAQALADQRLVLNQITALNNTTSSMIESTSQMLATQSVEIQQQASSATIGVDKLQAAFANIYQAMDALDTYKVQALDAMATTIGTLEVEVDKAQSYLNRINRSSGTAEGSADGKGLNIGGITIGDS